jgi:hypothetical protein
MDGSLPFPLSRSTLILGPSNVGKTRLTARALEAWIDREGVEGVVVLDFAPEVERAGRLLGGRLDRFTEIPDGAWRGVIEASAPRAEGRDDAGALELARRNAARARRILEAAPPEPRAVFVNDATIPFQAGDDPALLTGYCSRGEMAVLNAFAGEELGVADPVSRNERAAVDDLRAWAHRVVRLP